ncbi:transmembrane 220 family protein [Flavihumibacter stibioxidans]|uniref:Transmembrane family 220, helix n=1 Tax=Flavihumibacter stibioxidans TaxID=1834163 RepID=A0ABR7M7A6_9BACT|nr:transmembrane 220 family protein [Flavihumibacter stibioxidans]MBC6490615.1 hypothetical protein [Flavihumibacter stibioxidans]
MKIFNAVMIGVFVLSAALQYNDPDPLVWMAIYLFGALLCVQALKNRFNSYLYLAGFTVYLLYATYLLFAGDGVLSWLREHDAENIVQSMKATKPWIEQTREFGGLLILLAALGINWFLFRRKGRG